MEWYHHEHVGQARQTQRLGHVNALQALAAQAALAVERVLWKMRSQTQNEHARNHRRVVPAGPGMTWQGPRARRQPAAGRISAAM